LCFLFIEKANGEVVLQNSSRYVIQEAQNSLSGVRVSEEEILEDSMNIRYSSSDGV
jgi:hypothetical protein